MKIYYGSTFIAKEKLKEACIEYPIKLEYYKIINEDDMIKKDGIKFGICVEKTEYLGNNIRIEKKMIKYISNDERKVEGILEKLKNNEVTPIGLQDIIYDLSREVLFI